MTPRSASHPPSRGRRRMPAATIVLSTFALAMLPAACANPSTSPSPGKTPPELTQLPRSLTAAEQAAVAAGNGFSLSLFRSVNAATPASENVVLSPFSASVALGMTMNGAAGGTYEAMRRALGLADRPEGEINAAYRDLWKLLAGLDPSVKVTSANAIFHRQQLAVAQPFAQLGRDYFGATIRGLDFADQKSSLATINGWASDNTNGRIPTVLDAIGDDQVMFLLNALYFKGEWRSRFDVANTRPGPFTGADGRTRTVQLMHASNMPIRVGGDEAAEVGELLYGNGAYAMTIVMPRGGRASSVDDLVRGLTPERWSALLGTLRDATLPVALPRFTLTFSDTLNGALKQMGMSIAFTPAADFSRLFATPGRFAIDLVKQDVYLAVDEVGTEAAAVTTVGVVVTSAPRPFTVDRPFVFAIRERLSGTILFIGTVRQLGT